MEKGTPTSGMPLREPTLIVLGHAGLLVLFHISDRLRCGELRMTTTTAITMLAKKMVREKRLPFEVSVDPFYSDENMTRLRESIARMESTGATSHNAGTDE